MKIEVVCPIDIFLKNNVVRCKDCEYGAKSIDESHIKCHLDEDNSPLWELNDYCSYGKPKKQEKLNPELFIRPADEIIDIIEEEKQMIIEDNRTKKVNTFDDLEVGDVFMSDGYLFIKIPYMIDDDGLDEEGANAIKLRDGEPLFFYSDDPVAIVDAKVVIE